MSYQGIPTLLDDVSAAVAGLSPLGQRLFRSSIGTAALALRSRAHELGWLTATHEAFAEWTEAHTRDGLTWLSLDPLLATESGSVSRSFSVTRVATPQGWALDERWSPTLKLALSGHDVGLVDDAASSGATLAAVATSLNAIGARVRRILVGCALDRARERMRQECLPHLEAMMDQNCEAIHLRDAFFYLPRTGRRVCDQPPISAPGREIEVRVPVQVFAGGPWEELVKFGTVRKAAFEANLSCIARFSYFLGRAATAADISMLGEDVRLTTMPNHRPTLNSSLGDLLRLPIAARIA